MKIKFSVFYSFTTAFLFFITVTFSQKQKEKSTDSTLDANSENWKVKEHKSLMGIAKREFDFYSMLVAEKLNSPLIKKRKDSSEVGYSSEERLEPGKYKTIEKTTFYHAVSNERRRTMLGKTLSKNDIDAHL